MKAPGDSNRGRGGRPTRVGRPEFCQRYFAELNQRPNVWRPILDAARRRPVTLLFAVREAEHNHAAALRDYLLGDRPASEGKGSVASRSY